MSSSTNPPPAYPQYTYSASYSHTSPVNSTYLQPGGYGASCPPGCTCGYSATIQNSTNQQTQQYQGYWYSDYSNTSTVSSGGGQTSMQQYERGYSDQKQDHQQTTVAEGESPTEESGKYPFLVIIQAIARGLVGESYASTIQPEDFRTKLEPSDSQRLSGLLFFKSFTQRDLNLQCTLIMQVLSYWSLAETMPECTRPGSSESPSSYSPRERRRESGGSSKRKNRAPPTPRYWTRMENAAVIGLMLGLQFEILRVALEGRQTADLREVDAILDTNSAEALELLRTGQIPPGGRYQRDAQAIRRQRLPSSTPANIWNA